MKLKRDFVTNSSSTSYFVYIPDNFDIVKYLHLLSESDWKHLINDFNNLKNVKSKFQEVFDKYLLNEGIFYEDDNHTLYWMIIDIFSQLDLHLQKVDSPSDNGIIFNVNSKQNKTKIKEINSKNRRKNEIKT